MPVDWEREAARLAALARLPLGPEEAHELARACDAITRDFAELARYADGLPEAPPEAPGPLREDHAAPADAHEVEGILHAAPRVDPGRAIVAPKGLP